MAKFEVYNKNAEPPTEPGSGDPPCGPSYTLDDVEQVRLTFSTVSGAAGYRIYRRPSDDDPWQKLGETTTSPFLDTNLGRPSYQYAVSAVFDTNTDGTWDAEGPNSLAATADDDFAEHFPPSPPCASPCYSGAFQGVRFLERGSSGAEESLGHDMTYVYLTWSPLLEQRLVGYNVYRMASPGGGNGEGTCPWGWERISGLKPVRQTSYLDPDVDPTVRAWTNPVTHELAPYSWRYLVTAVLERPDGSRVETRNIDAGYVSLDNCLTNGLGCNICSTLSSYPSTLEGIPFPTNGLEHEPGTPWALPPAAPVPTASQGFVDSSWDTGSDRVVEVSWDAASDPSTLAGYYLYYRSSETNEAWKPVDSFLVDEDDDGTLEMGSAPILLGRFQMNPEPAKVVWLHPGRLEKTDYKVVAVDQAGRTSQESQPVTGWPYAPPPQNFQATRQEGFTRVKWHLNTSDAPTNDFNIYRRLNCDSPVPDLVRVATLRAWTETGGEYIIWNDPSIEALKH